MTAPQNDPPGLITARKVSILDQPITIIVTINATFQGQNLLAFLILLNFFLSTPQSRQHHRRKKCYWSSKISLNCSNTQVHLSHFLTMVQPCINASAASTTTCHPQNPDQPRHPKRHPHCLLPPHKYYVPTLNVVKGCPQPLFKGRQINLRPLFKGWLNNPRPACSALAIAIPLVQHNKPCSPMAPLSASVLLTSNSTMAKSSHTTPSTNIIVSNTAMATARSSSTTTPLPSQAYATIFQATERLNPPVTPPFQGVPISKQSKPD